MATVTLTTAPITPTTPTTRTIPLIPTTLAIPTVRTIARFQAPVQPPTTRLTRDPGERIHLHPRTQRRALIRIPRQDIRRSIRHSRLRQWQGPLLTWETASGITSAHRPQRPCAPRRPSQRQSTRSTNRCAPIRFLLLRRRSDAKRRRVKTISESVISKGGTILCGINCSVDL